MYSRGIILSFLVFLMVHTPGCGALQQLKRSELSMGKSANAASPVREPSSINTEQPNFIWPIVGGRLSPIGGFGPRRRYKRTYLHKGIDILGEKNSPVFAAATGVVVYVGRATGYGRTIIVEHNPRWATLYAHLSEYQVKVNDIIEAGDQIAKLGRSGNATNYLLHFEIRHDEKPVSPLKFLPSSIPNSLY